MYLESEDYFPETDEDYMNTRSKSPIEIPPKNFDRERLGKRIELAGRTFKKPGQVEKADFEIAALPEMEDSDAEDANSGSVSPNGSNSAEMQDETANQSESNPTTHGDKKDEGGKSNVMSVSHLVLNNQVHGDV